MSKTVFLYTMNGCPYCNDIKSMLEEEDIKFIQRDIDEYEMQYAILKESTKNDYVPAFEIRDDNKMTKRFLVPERDFEELEDAVNLVKKFVL